MADLKLAGACENDKGDTLVVFGHGGDAECVMFQRRGDDLVAAGRRTEEGPALDYLQVESTRDGWFLVPDDEIPVGLIEQARAYLAAGGAE